MPGVTVLRLRLADAQAANGKKAPASAGAFVQNSKQFEAQSKLDQRQLAGEQASLLEVQVHWTLPPTACGVRVNVGLVPGQPVFCVTTEITPFAIEMLET